MSIPPHPFIASLIRWNSDPYFFSVSKLCFPAFLIFTWIHISVSYCACLSRFVVLLLRLQFSRFPIFFVGCLLFPRCRIFLNGFLFPICRADVVLYLRYVPPDLYLLTAEGFVIYQDIISTYVVSSCVLLTSRIFFCFCSPMSSFYIYCRLSSI